MTKFHHLVNMELISLINKLKEKGYDYKVYIHDEAMGKLGVLLGDFEALWFIDIVEYILPVDRQTVENLAIGLSIELKKGDSDVFYDVNTADEAMTLITEFFGEKE